MKIGKFFLRVLPAVAMIATTLSTTTLTTSCDIARQAQGAYNMVNCEYDFHSLTGISVAGINVSGSLSLLDAPRILNLLSGNATTIPVACTVNLDVKNPNSTDAILNGMDYILSIDGIDFTSGSVAERFSVVKGGTGTLPLAISFDVATLLRGESRDAVVGVIRNLISTTGVGNILGLGGGSNKPSEVTLSIRPTFDVGGYRVPSPVYIPVKFSFGGE